MDTGLIELVAGGGIGAVFAVIMFQIYRTDAQAHAVTIERLTEERRQMQLQILERLYAQTDKSLEVLAANTQALANLTQAVDRISQIADLEKRLRGNRDTTSNDDGRAKP